MSEKRSTSNSFSSPSERISKGVSASCVVLSMIVCSALPRTGERRKEQQANSATEQESCGQARS